LKPDVIAALVHHYAAHHQLRIAHLLDLNPEPGAMSINYYASFHQFVVIDGRRIIPSTCARQGRTSPARSALIKARIDDTFWYGEVLEIISHEQGDLPPTTFVRVRWMKEFMRRGQLGVPTRTDYWDEYLCVVLRLFDQMNIHSLAVQTST
jgi:hypothetical protein